MKPHLVVLALLCWLPVACTQDAQPNVGGSADIGGPAVDVGQPRDDVGQPRDASGDVGFLDAADSGLASSRNAGTQSQLDTFYAMHGGRGAFPQNYVESIEALVDIEDLVVLGDFAGARAGLDAHFASYPMSDDIWFQGVQQDGTNVGNPVAYYGLRMLDDIVTTGLAGPPAATIPLTMGVVMANCGEGLQPADLDFQQPGVPVTLTLAAELEANDYAIVKQSARLFQYYVWSITDGRVTVDVELEIVDVCVDVRWEGRNRADAVNPQIVVENASPELRARADMWWVLYPSNVPTGAEFAGHEFITGGMGAYGANQPMFIADDLWIVRKPPHIGTGPYTELERRVYLPQWLWHEFFHHLARTWPEYGLETTSHQWFDRSTWPDDFVGKWEPDYYAEAVDKRLRSADPPIHVALQTAPPSPEVTSLLAVADLVGDYRHDPVTNDWHNVTVVEDANGLRWRNAANVEWSLTWENGVLRAGPDCPYGESDLVVDLVRDADGQYTTTVQGLWFQGALYRRL